MPHVLVTGSSGTIGTRLCETLLERGYRVSGLDWKPNAWKPELNDITTIADLRHADSLDTVADDVDVVVHLAANARVYDLVEDPTHAHDNITTTFNVLKWMRKRGVRKILFSSSREVYGNDQVAESYTEDMVHVEHQESPYAASKLADEALIQSYTRCYGIDHIIFRFSNVYGMYDDSDRIMPLFIRRTRAGEPITVYGKEKCLDFTYIDDTVDGVIRGIERFDDAKNDTYNLAYGQGTTLVHVAEEMVKLAGSSSQITVGESRTGEVVRYVANISKAKRVLGYEPQTPFSQGLRKTIEWYRAHQQ